MYVPEPLSLKIFLKNIKNILNGSLLNPRSSRLYKYALPYVLFCLFDTFTILHAIRKSSPYFM